ncbi:hypothetical protein I4U23_020182 [Adineta vaga]|nr:hypothetical protein I4U23_020182 [Adineta vaga]
MSSNTDLTRSITLYGGIPLLICGITGNLLNLILLWSTRRNSCAFLFLCSSILNCSALFFGLFTRILSVGFGLDWSQTNVIWCKIRIAFTEVSFLTSLTCICLASIDRCLASCRAVKYRKFSQLSTARWMISISCLIWICHALPYMIYADLIQSSPSSTKQTCSIHPNEAFSNYRIYFSLLFYLGIFPTFILISTGLITYRNINKLAHNHQRELIQKQLTNMMLIQIPIILISTIPYIVFNEYRIATATYVKSSEKIAIENIMANIVTLLFYITFSCQFFVFFFSSPQFRHQAESLVLPRHKNQVSQDLTVGIITHQ